MNDRVSRRDVARHSTTWCPQRVLITGGQGYLGAVLTELLAACGFDVVVLDNGAVPGARIDSPAVTYHHGDIGQIAVCDGLSDGVSSVVHLAAVVGDPACGVNPDTAWQTNYLGTIQVAEACRQHGVRTLVFASTCSNYGMTDDEEADIWSPLNPQSVYAETKMHAEHHLLSLQNPGLSVHILRLATLHGLSPRMRFDLAVNRMTADAVTSGRVTVHGGSQWRPFLHVRDAAEAIRIVLEREHGTCSRIYNCGFPDQNFRLDEVAGIVVDTIPTASITVQTHDTDPRNYRVNFEPIKNDLRFVRRYGVHDSVREIAAALRAGSHVDPNDPKYSNFLTASSDARQPHGPT